MKAILMALLIAAPAENCLSEGIYAGFLIHLGYMPEWRIVEDEKRLEIWTGKPGVVLVSIGGGKACYVGRDHQWQKAKRQPA